MPVYTIRRGRSVVRASWHTLAEEFCRPTRHFTFQWQGIDLRAWLGSCGHAVPKFGGRWHSTRASNGLVLWDVRLRFPRTLRHQNAVHRRYGCLDDWRSHYLPQDEWNDSEGRCHAQPDSRAMYDGNIPHHSTAILPSRRHTRDDPAP